MINVYKDIPLAFQSNKQFKLYKTYTFDATSIGTGSSDMKIFDAVYAASSSSEITPIYRPYTDPYTYDSARYIVNYNYTLANGEKYMPVSESLNPNGSVKRLIHKSLKRLFYDPDCVYREKYFFNTSVQSDSPLKNTAFLFYLPPKYIAESIESYSLEFSDISDINNQPYGNTNPAGIHIIDSGSNGFLYDINNTYQLDTIGNISYETGHIIITDESYRNYFFKNMMETASNANFAINIISYYTATECEYVCVAAADEFNASTNVTLYDEQVDALKPQGTGKIKSTITSDPYFRTQITSIGLYDDTSPIPVVVAKFAKPIRKERTLDSVFIVKFDI